MTRSCKKHERNGCNGKKSMADMSNTQHVSVLCCVNAAGSTLPPLIVFSRVLPAVRTFQHEGPVNACYSHSDTDSGFVVVPRTRTNQASSMQVAIAASTSKGIHCPYLVDQHLQRKPANMVVAQPLCACPSQRR